MNHIHLHKFVLMVGIAGLTAATAQAQFSPGKLAVLRAGDNGTSAASSILNGHQAPIFVDQYDPVTPITIAGTNTGTNGPIYSVAIPTNDPPSAPPFASMWFNGHAGTEGYLALSADAGTLSFSGYGGDILAVPGTPSQTNVPRGICVIDVSGNTSIAYEGGNWYSFTGTQINPRGVVSDNGTNNFFGSGSLNGNEWYQLGNGATPESIQNFNSTRDVKIINGFFYTSLQGSDGGALYPPGIYDYAPVNDFGALEAPVALPEGDVFFLNLVVPASPLYPNVEGFDINPQKNVAYTADNTYGIQKYVEVAGNWTLACAFGITNNTSTNVSGFPVSYTGCFGLVVDWSGTYPVVFATTTEGNGGYANSNRLIRLDDNYNFTDGQLHTNLNVTTLATGWSGNIVFRGLAWAPNRQPVITANPANQSVVAATPVTFAVVATTLFPNTYYWLTNGIVDPTQTTTSYSVPSGSVDGTYQVIVSNTYGAVTSTVANLTVTSGSVAPTLTSPVPALSLTNALDDTITIPAVATGTTPLNYQWWQSTSPGSTTQLSDTGDFTGTATGTLTINVSSSSDSGSYYVVINNTTGEPSSNLVAVVNIITPLPVLYLEPVNTTAATNGQAVFNALAYPPYANYQWYQGNSPLSDNSHWSGSQGPTLTDLNAQGSDATNYYVVISDAGGSVTSSVVSLTVETPAAYSALPYTSLGQIYTQNFDSLPDPGVKSVNASTGVQTTIGNITYDMSNPFDFAAAIGTNGVNAGLGGLELSNTMIGWYSSDTGSEQIQATSGDNTTGLIISLGCTNAVNNVNPLYPTNNRALGMVSSPATSAGGNAGNISDGVFALRIRNLTGQTLTSFNLSYVSELWRNTPTVNMITNYFYVDPFGTNTTPTNNWTGSLTNMTFWTNYGTTPPSVTTVYGTNAPIATTNMSFVNVPLGTSWTPGGILWIVWQENVAESKSQEMGIDNLVFSTGAQPSLQIQQSGPSTVISWPQMFTGYTLQYNTNLADPAGWQNVTQAVTPFEGMNIVTNPLPNTAGFFRLSSN